MSLTLLAFAAMVGGLAIARAIRDVDEAASDAILQAVAARLHRMLTDEVQRGGFNPAGVRPDEVAGISRGANAVPSRQ